MVLFVCSCFVFVPFFSFRLQRWKLHQIAYQTVFDFLQIRFRPLIKFSGNSISCFHAKDEHWEIDLDSYSCNESSFQCCHVLNHFIRIYDEMNISCAHRITKKMQSSTWFAFHLDLFNSKLDSLAGFESPKVSSCIQFVRLLLFIHRFFWFCVFFHFFPHHKLAQCVPHDLFMQSRFITSQHEKIPTSISSLFTRCALFWIK